MRKHYLFDSKLYYSFLHILLFFYIYSIQFVGVPLSIGTRVFMGIIGFSMFSYKLLETFKPFVFNKQFLNLYIALFFISFFSFLSVIYNKTFDLEFFLKYQISIVIIIFASYFVTKMISYGSKDDRHIPIIFKLFINVVLIQIAIALIMFVFPPIRDSLNTIQVTSELELKLLEKTLEFRLIGFGSKFFGSGIVNGFALILIGSIIKYNSDIKINVLKHALSFLFIFIFGMMMARTTIIGALLALGIVFWPSLKLNLNQIKNNLKFLFFIFFIPTILIFAIFSLFPEIRDSLELAFNFGFEMFVNYFESNSMESASTNELKDMFIWPQYFKTYIIGDGLFSNIETGGYYMETDIGILRLIYYFGIFGLLAYFIFQFQVCYGAYLINDKYKYMFAVIFLYCIVLNYKGFTDLFFLNILFFINNTCQHTNINEKNAFYNGVSSK